MGIAGDHNQRYDRNIDSCVVFSSPSITGNDLKPVGGHIQRNCFALRDGDSSSCTVNRKQTVVVPDTNTVPNRVTIWVVRLYRTHFPALLCSIADFEVVCLLSKNRRLIRNRSVDDWSLHWDLLEKRLLSGGRPHSPQKV